MNINLNQFVNGCIFFCKASEIGLPPGAFPKVFDAQLGDTQYTLTFEQYDGLKQVATYTSGGITLHVAND